MTKKTGDRTAKRKKTAESGKKTQKRRFSRLTKGIGLLKAFFLNRKTIRFVFAVVAVAAVYVGYCAATLPDIEKAVKNTRAPKVPFI